MQDMFITPITPFTPITPIKTLGELSGTDTQANPLGIKDIPFKDVFSTAIQNLKETEITSNNDTALLALGEIDDLHTIGIDATKAYLAERLVIELRNRAMEAYTELMRINL